MPELSASAIEQNIIRIISTLSLVSPEEIKLEDNLREDLALDSVASMELLSALAEELDIDIEMEEAIGIDTVGAVVKMAHERLGKA